MALCTAGKRGIKRMTLSYLCSLQLTSVQWQKEALHYHHMIINEGIIRDILTLVMKSGFSKPKKGRVEKRK